MKWAKGKEEEERIWLFSLVIFSSLFSCFISFTRSFQSLVMKWTRRTKGKRPTTNLRNDMKKRPKEYKWNKQSVRFTYLCVPFGSFGSFSTTPLCSFLPFHQLQWNDERREEMKRELVERRKKQRTWWRVWWMVCVGWREEWRETMVRE